MAVARASRSQWLTASGALLPRWVPVCLLDHQQALAMPRAVQIGLPHLVD